MNTVMDEAQAVLLRGQIETGLTPFEHFTDEGLKRVRRIYAELAPTRETLAALFAIDAAQTAPTAQWTGFFIETASSQLIWDERPTGILLDKDASWLLARFDDAPSLSIMALMVRIIEEAHRVPAWFHGAVRQRASLFRNAFLSADAAQQEHARKPVPYLRLVA